MQTVFTSYKDHCPELSSITHSTDVSCSAFKNKFGIILMHELQVLLFQLNIVKDFVRLHLYSFKYIFMKINFISYIIAFFWQF